MISIERSGLKSKQYEKTLFVRTKQRVLPNVFAAVHYNRVAVLPGKKGPRRKFIQKQVGFWRMVKIRNAARGIRL